MKNTFEPRRFQRLRKPQKYRAPFSIAINGKICQTPEALKAALAKSKHTSIRITNQSINSKCAEALAEALEANNGITELALWEGDIGADGAKAFAKALKKKDCNITKLNIDFVNIGGEGTKALAEALPYSQVTELSLVHNGINDEGTKALAEALPRSKVTKIYLTDNRIGDEGAEYLAEALSQKSCHITKLHLKDNKIGSKGAEYLAEEIGKSKVTNINLNDNKIGFKGTLALAKSLGKHGSHVQKLHMKGNKIDIYGAQMLISALGQENCKITKLCFDVNDADFVTKEKGNDLLLGADALIKEKDPEKRKEIFDALKQDHPFIQKFETKMHET